VCLARRSAAAELGLAAGDLVTLAPVDERATAPASVSVTFRR
jgi:hypothetical protein